MFSWLTKNEQMIEGSIVCDKRTKQLIKRIRPGQIAVIDHEDIDEMAAYGLVEKKVKAVINLAPSLTGKYPNRGPKILYEKAIPLLEYSFLLSRRQT